MNQQQYDYQSESCQPYTESKESPAICVPDLLSLTLFQSKHCTVTSENCSWRLLYSDYKPTYQLNNFASFCRGIHAFQASLTPLPSPPSILLHATDTASSKTNLMFSGQQVSWKNSSPQFVICLGYFNFLFEEAKKSILKQINLQPVVQKANGI